MSLISFRYLLAVSINGVAIRIGRQFGWRRWLLCLFLFGTLFHTYTTIENKTSDVIPCILDAFRFICTIDPH